MACCGGVQERCLVPEYRCHCQEECLEDQRKKLSIVPPPDILYDAVEYQDCLAACPETAVVPQVPDLDEWLLIGILGALWPFGPTVYGVAAGPEVFNKDYEQCASDHQAAMQTCQDQYFACLVHGTPTGCFAAQGGCWLQAWQNAVACQADTLESHGRHLREWFTMTKGGPTGRMQTTCAVNDDGRNQESPRVVDLPDYPNLLPQCLLTAGVQYVQAAWPVGLAAGQAMAGCLADYGDAAKAAGHGPLTDAEAALWACKLQAMQEFQRGLIEPGVTRGLADGACVAKWLEQEIGAFGTGLPYTNKRPVCMGDYLGALKGADRAGRQQHRQCQAEIAQCMSTCAPVEVGTAVDDTYFCGGLCNMYAADCAARVEREERLLPRHKLCREYFQRPPRSKQDDGSFPGPFGHARGVCTALCENTIRLCESELAEAHAQCRYHCGGDTDCLDHCDDLNVFRPTRTPCGEALEHCVEACRDNPGGQENLVVCLTTCATRFEKCHRTLGGTDHVCGKDYPLCRTVCETKLFPDCPDCGADARDTSNGILGLPNFFDYELRSAVFGYTGFD